MRRWAHLRAGSSTRVLASSRQSTVRTVQPQGTAANRGQFRPAARKPRKLSPDAITKAIQLAQTGMS